LRLRLLAVFQSRGWPPPSRGPWADPKLRRLADKYAPLVPVLRELIARPDTPLYADVKDRIIAQLDNAAQHFVAIGMP
jgi:hypothetical protein